MEPLNGLFCLSSMGLKSCFVDFLEVVFKLISKICIINVELEWYFNTLSAELITIWKINTERRHAGPVFGAHTVFKETHSKQICDLFKYLKRLF